jgi:sarcosine oxidase subunit gamma
MLDSSFEGYVKVSQSFGQHMFTLRATLSSTKVKTARRSVLGGPIPKRGFCDTYAGKSVAWMSPDELLITVPGPTSGSIYADLQKALVGQHALLSDVSDSRAVFTLTGTKVPEVLAKLAPMDFHPAKFKVGSFTRTRFAQVAGAVFRVGEDKIILICFRSVQQYMFSLLCDAARQDARVF